MNEKKTQERNEYVPNNRFTVYVQIFATIKFHEFGILGLFMCTNFSHIFKEDILLSRQRSEFSRLDN